jgi:prepilin-type N-terminal cleavage/methylation domain-containing protein
MNSRAGTTLLELVVALAVLAILAGIAGVAMRAPREPDPIEVRASRVAAARRAALETRRPVPLLLPSGAGMVEGVAYPDGRVLLADSALDVDPLSGRPRARE